MIMVKATLHDGPMEAGAFVPIGARIGWDVKPTDREQRAMNFAARQILQQAVEPSRYGYTPEGLARVIRWAVG